MCDELVLKNPDATGKIVLRLPNGSRRVSLGERFVLLPIEVAAMARFGVHVGQLQQPFAAHHSPRHCVPFGDFRLGVAHIGCRLEACLRARKRLEEVSPEDPFIASSIIANRGQNRRTSRATPADSISGGKEDSTNWSHCGSQDGAPSSSFFSAIRGILAGPASSPALEYLIEKRISAESDAAHSPSPPH